eukprot:1760477-Prorocentrum_lima.AAC.1
MGVQVPLLLKGRTDPAFRGQKRGRGKPLKVGETQPTLRQWLICHLQAVSYTHLTLPTICSV